ncbi:MAG: endonuclease/exonuclease/phosphatase family protein [Formivibrio sp.]|nr:endonuclease/exonuclease/phosphatase family protein [Formivibrio sp.]
MDKRLRIASYNIHKGVSTFNRRLILHEVRRELLRLNPDLVFLQEVQGEHLRRALRFDTWPDTPQHEFLAGEHLSSAYGRNANHRLGHHGNALLSRFPIGDTHNLDLTLHRFEQRGLLHCVLQPATWNQPLHALCVHLNLLAHDRRRQLSMLVQYIQNSIPPLEPLVLAGDFNDWSREATFTLKHELGLAEAFETLHGTAAKSFPARMPFLRLDRIYTRGFNIEVADVLTDAHWIGLSDHVPLFTVLHRRDA